MPRAEAPALARQSAQADFVSSLRRIHSLCPGPAPAARCRLAPYSPIPYSLFPIPYSLFPIP
ncbi:MAG TPA: hypothetical protein VK358_15955 [Longimicrobium sp.]|nr:hypothetical protein [Longimicrobium sp.]